MKKNDIIRKLTSRKFLLALVGVVSGLALAFGVEGSEIQEMVSTVGGILAAVGSAIVYIKAEARVDAASAANCVQFEHNPEEGESDPKIVTAFRDEVSSR